MYKGTVLILDLRDKEPEYTLNKLFNSKQDFVNDIKYLLSQVPDYNFVESGRFETEDTIVIKYTGDDASMTYTLEKIN